MVYVKTSRAFNNGGFKKAIFSKETKSLILINSCLHLKVVVSNLMGVGLLHLFGLHNPNYRLNWVVVLTDRSIHCYNYWGRIARPYYRLV